MMRWSLVTLTICTLAIAPEAWAADPVPLKKPADKAKPMGELNADQVQVQQRESEIKQEQLKRQFDDFKQSLVRLAQRLESSTKQEDKDKAAILKKAILMASEQGVDAKFTTLITELKRGDTFKDLDKLQELISKNSDLRNDIRSMIELLLKDDRDAALREERQRTEKMLEKLKELIGKEERMRAAIDQGRKDAESLKRDQEKVTKETRELIDPSKKGDTKKGEAKNAGESKNYSKAEAKYDTKENKGDRRNQEGSDSKEGKPSEAKGNEGKEGKEGSDSKEGKPSDSKEGKGGDSKEGKPSDSKEGKGGDSKEGKESKGGDSKDGKGGDSKEGKPSDSKEGKGGNSKEGKPGDSKENKGGDSKEGKPGDSKEGKGDGKGGEAKEGKPGEGKEGKPGDSKENKGNQGKPSDSKPGEGSKNGQPKPGEGKGGEAKSGEGKTGEGKDSQGSPSKPGQSSESKGQGEGKGQGKGGESKPSEGGQSGKGGESKPSQSGQGGQGGQGKPSGSPPPPSGQQPPQDNNPAKKQIKDSNKYQESAEKNIEDKKNPEASKDIDKAIEKLEQAKKQLEDLLKQLREEEIERLLAALQGRCERMLALQIGVRDNTVNINDKVKDKKLTSQERRAAEQEANIQSDKEDEIVQEANTAIRLIEAEGSAIAFAEVFKQVRGDMVNVSGRLRKTDVGTVTITVENDIIATLQEMVDALKQARKDNQSPPMPPGPPGQSGPPPDQRLIDQIAELKMIRSMQEKVNKRTTIYGKEYSGEQAPAPSQGTTEAEREHNAMIQRELKELGTRQEKIGKVTDDISKGKNKAN